MQSLLWQICDIVGLIFIIANAQLLKNNPTILSHWLPCKAEIIFIRTALNQLCWICSYLIATALTTYLQEAKSVDQQLSIFMAFLLNVVLLLEPMSHKNFRVTNLVWNKALRLETANHVHNFNQSECIISECISNCTLIFFIKIGSCKILAWLWFSGPTLASQTHYSGSKL